jgi:hypothetical protein
MRNMEKSDHSNPATEVSALDAEARKSVLISAMEESMDRFAETYRLLATEALSDDPAP